MFSIDNFQWDLGLVEERKEKKKFQFPFGFWIFLQSKKKRQSFDEIQCDSIFLKKGNLAWKKGNFLLVKFSTGFFVIIVRRDVDFFIKQKKLTWFLAKIVWKNFKQHQLLLMITMMMNKFNRQNLLSIDNYEIILHFVVVVQHFLQCNNNNNNNIIYKKSIN